MFLKYFESGLSIIPLVGKVPYKNEWQRFCDILPDRSLVESWERIQKIDPKNIGVCLGRASKIVAVDIDTDDKLVLDTVPMSPVRRRGKKGEVRFFKYDPKIESRNYHHIGVEILSTGRQAVLPPSIHPETLKPYEWITPDTLLNFSVQDLPELDLSFISVLEPKFHIQKQAGGGRNNKLKDIITSMRSRAEPEQLIVNEVYEYDLKYHEPRLFTDPKESYRATTEEAAKKAAWEMVLNVTRSLIRNGIATLEPEAVTIEIDTPIKPITFQEKNFPVPRGLISDFVKICDGLSNGRQDAIGLGAALALMSTVCSNRFRVGKTWSNLFVLNIAKSGSGKNVSQRLIAEILDETGLIGSTHYKSATSLYSELPKQQERLDILDEASMLLKAMQSHHSHQAEMVEILSHLFSCSNSKFLGVASVGMGQKFGACFNPCINLLASTTPDGFKSSVSKEMGSKGLMPRFLTFYQSDLGKFKNEKEMKAEMSALKKTIIGLIDTVGKKTHPEFKPAPKNLLAQNEMGSGIQYDPYELLLTQEANELLQQYQRNCFNQVSSGCGFEEPFRARFTELAIKVAICDSVSRGRITEMDVSSIQWGIEVVETAWHNASQLYELSSAENERESYTIRILNLIRQKGRITASDLVRKTQFLDSRTRKDVLDGLEQSGSIRKVTIQTNKRPNISYEILDQ